MPETYKSSGEATEDKRQLTTLLEALNAAPSTLRRDGSLLWILKGSRGYCSTWGDGQSFSLNPTDEMSGFQWTWVKKRLAFCEVTQDGDCEGVLKLDRLPTIDEAATIRDVLGLRRKMEFSPEELERRRKQLQAMRSHQ